MGGLRLGFFLVLFGGGRSGGLFLLFGGLFVGVDLLGC